MLVSFTPDTDLERAFAQAAGWDEDKLWKEADRNGDREDRPRFLGQSACLAYHCAVDGRRRHLNTITTAMIACIDQLSDSQRKSLFRVCSHLVAEVIDQEVALESIDVRLILRILCAVIRKTEQRSITFVDMLKRLGDMLGQQPDEDQLNQLSQRCEQTAAAVGLLQQAELERERKEAFLRRIPPANL